MKLPDDRLIAVWTCRSCGDAVEVSPTFYEGTGAPVCGNCDNDMNYSHTELLEQGKEPLPLAKIAQYVENKGDSCPYCGSDSLTGEGFLYEAGQITQPVRCDGCNRTWEDVFTLSGIIEEVF